MNNSSLYFGEVRHQRKDQKTCILLSGIHGSFVIDEIKEVFKRIPFGQLTG